MIYEDNKWRVWYGAGNEFIPGPGKTLPVYNIRYMESEDGRLFPDKGKVVLDIKDGIYRVGRPNVIKNGKYYEMFYGYSTKELPYRLAYARSEDGRNWVEDKNYLGLSYNQEDFDSNMSAYPGVVFIEEKQFMFYNGNNYGFEGIGLAVKK